MAQGVEASFKYQGLRVTCDEEALARLRRHICDDPSVAESIRGQVAPANLSYITIALPSPEPEPSRPRWPLLALMAVGSTIFSGVPLIVGWVTIARWLMRLSG